ncbi:hypothetical protein J8281_13975 [Aquimarina sp. U1-2]|uniref:DUF6427 family protein n=1 Tax=Aquimarina sp. U1-2 TaxID=2823141 RepID=UPI00352FFBB1|nr:hypothetical protein [Aquimarina sp. U1-2]
MLTSFFSKSKPITYIVIALYILVLYGTTCIKSGIDTRITSILLYLLDVFLVIGSVFILQFIVQKNDLTIKGAYTIFLYACLVCTLPNAFINNTSFLLLSHFLVVLGFQNLVYLRDGKQLKSKLFNASICIALASLAYFWSIGFMFLIFIAVAIFAPQNYRNWIIPLLGVIMIYVFANCFTLLVYDIFFPISRYIDTVSFTFEPYLSGDELVSVGVIGLCTIFFGLLFLFKFSRKSANQKPVLRLIVAYLIIAMGIAAIAPQKNTSELFFMATPLAIIGSTYLEMQYHKFAKEINIWVFLLIPVVILWF